MHRTLNIKAGRRRHINELEMSRQKCQTETPKLDALASPSYQQNNAAT